MLEKRRPPQSNQERLDLLDPLVRFYRAAQCELPEVEFVDGSKVPAPYRTLLVHSNDMTSTLENFHGGQIHLQVLRTSMKDDVYEREVVLALDGNNKPVEFGAIRICLSAFPAEARKLIQAGHRPLGAILHDCSIQSKISPKAYFRVESDDTMNKSLGLSKRHALFGRCNHISSLDGKTLADIVEILPPLKSL